MSFIDFAKDHIDVFIEGMVQAQSTMPFILNQPDWRFMKGRWISDSIFEEMNKNGSSAVFRRVEDHSFSYDFSYLPASVNERISLKTQKTIMQRYSKKTCKDTSPRDIIIVNTNSTKINNQNISERVINGSDWLLAIQSQIGREQKMAIGIIAYSKVLSLLKRRDGCYTAKIYNRDWDYLYQSACFWSIKEHPTADVKFFQKLYQLRKELSEDINAGV